MISVTNKAKPNCTPPGYAPHRLLIIVGEVIVAYVQRSTCISCRIPSHASIGGKYEGGSSEGKCPFPGVSVRFPMYWCGQQESLRSTVALVYYTYRTVERVVAEYT